MAGLIQLLESMIKPFLKLLPLITISSILAMWSITPVSGQDDFSLPGDSEPVTTNAEAVAAQQAAASNKNLFDMIREGGWAMWPLGGMSLALVGLSVWLMLDLQKARFVPKRLVEDLERSMAEGDLERGMEIASSSPTCLGQVMNGALVYTSKRGYHVLDSDSLYDQMADASQLFNRNRAKTINYLSVISQAAPMLGLLGTVSGMIKAFGTLASGGMGDPGKLAGNISEALMTTATGLVVSLPAVFLYFAFRDKLADMISQSEAEASKLLNLLRDFVVEHYGQEAGQEA